jgi:hypothetical protein
MFSSIRLRRLRKMQSTALNQSRKRSSMVGKL